MRCWSRGGSPSILSRFENYTHSEPRFRVLLTDEGSREIHGSILELILCKNQPRFSTGELVSLLFILPKRVAWVLPDPQLRRLLAEDALSQLTRRNSFIELLIAN